QVADRHGRHGRAASARARREAQPPRGGGADFRLHSRGGARRAQRRGADGGRRPRDRARSGDGRHPRDDSRNPSRGDLSRRHQARDRARSDPMTEPATLIMEAADFAARRHAGQRRKGVAGEPYVNHLIEVATLLAEATGGSDATLVAAALLHDTLEDTATEYEELDARFGPQIAALVAAVTDDKSLPKAERKRRQIENAPGATPQAKLLKIADKTSNVRALIVSPPTNWDVVRIADYIDWAEKVVAG